MGVGEKLRIMAATNWKNSIFNSTFPMDARIVQYQLYDENWSAEWLSAPGKELFGYHCIEPSQLQYLNSFIERPLIQNRLMFWFAASTRMTGWLYWSVVHNNACPAYGHPEKKVARPANGPRPALSDFRPDDVWTCKDNID